GRRPERKRAARATASGHVPQPASQRGGLPYGPGWTPADTVTPGASVSQRHQAHRPLRQPGHDSFTTPAVPAGEQPARLYGRTAGRGTCPAIPAVPARFGDSLPVRGLRQQNLDSVAFNMTRFGGAAPPGKIRTIWA